MPVNKLFTEASTVETSIRDPLGGAGTHNSAVGSSFARRIGKLSAFGWNYLAPANVPRTPRGALVVDRVGHALRRLNPGAVAIPERSHEETNTFRGKSRRGLPKGA